MWGCRKPPGYRSRPGGARMRRTPSFAWPVPIEFSLMTKRATAPEGTATAKTYAFVSLGCPKNLVDSERMLGRLAQDGYALVPEADGADVVVVNTCGFIEPARQESLSVIREMLELKKQGRVGSVVVAGCLAERKKEELLQVV